VGIRKKNHIWVPPDDKVGDHAGSLIASMTIDLATKSSPKFKYTHEACSPFRVMMVDSEAKAGQQLSKEREREMNDWPRQVAKARIARSALCGSSRSPELARASQEIKQNDQPTDLSLSGARSKTKSRESRRRIGRGKARKKVVLQQGSRPLGCATWGAPGDPSCPSVTAYLASSWIENDPRVMDGLGAARRNPDFAYPC
ncbi:hypothetical protein ALC62_11741, partial [Cyphomyrmex costatus]